MSTQTQLPFIYLDTEADRETLIQRIESVRESVLALADAVPESEWYTPRYHGWSLGATLGHLNLVDSLSMFLIRAALVGFRPRISDNTLHRANDFTARVFQRRLVPSSRRSALNNQDRIYDLIRSLPMDRLSTDVYIPTIGTLTVEKGLQYLFLFHWEGHLETMRAVEGIQPTAGSDSI